MLIPLTKGQFAEVDDEDAYLTEGHWYSFWNKTSNSFYAARNLPNRKQSHTQFLHRHILGLSPIDSIKVDHKDGNTLNCKRSNLRKCTQQQNNFNKRIHRNSSTGIAGVSWMERLKKYRAYIMFNYKQIVLGYFKDIEEAKAARVTAEQKYFGEFAPKREG